MICKRIRRKLSNDRLKNKKNERENREKEDPLGVADDRSFSSKTVRSDLRFKQRVVGSHYGIRSIALHSSVAYHRRRGRQPVRPSPPTSGSKRSGLI
jgi:hypothetical protein